jgi:hypothetical protein
VNPIASEEPEQDVYGKESRRGYERFFGQRGKRQRRLVHDMGR